MLRPGNTVKSTKTGKDVETEFRPNETLKLAICETVEAKMVAMREAASSVEQR
jgi:hypothetical protein